MPVELDLHYVDELISVRRQQHGGQRGAPGVVQGYREGESLNRSCIVMLSALIQGFVENVFTAASEHVMPRLARPGALEKYKDTFRRWGNPSARNVTALFARIGIADVLDGVSWPNCANPTVRSRLNHLNEIRNDIAHGARDLRVNGAAISLSLASAVGYRNFAEQFGARFEAHVMRRLR